MRPNKAYWVAWSHRSGVHLEVGKNDPTKRKALFEKWKKKLEKSGFRDIEDEHGRFTDHGSVYDLWQRVSFRAGIMEDVRDYYYWATDMSMRGKFRSSADRKIWQLHSRGYSTREIALDVPFDQTYIARKIKVIRAYLRLQTNKEDDH